MEKTTTLMSSEIFDRIDIDIKLDKAITNFLERRELEKVPFSYSNSVLDTNENLSFIRVKTIVCGREDDKSDISLLDFQQLLSAMASAGGRIAYLVEGNPHGIIIYIGSTNADQLKDTFEGIFSGSESTIDQPNFSPMKHTKAMLGIPSLKRGSDKIFKQGLENVIGPMMGKDFRLLIIGESYDTAVIQEIVYNFRQLGGGIHQLAKVSRNITEGQTESFGLTETRNLTKTEGLSEGSSKTSSLSNTEGTSTGTSKRGKLAGIAGLGVAGGTAFAGLKIGTAVGTSVGGIGGGISGLMTGALTGLAAGTTFPGLGNVIGAAAGGVTGLIGGTAAGISSGYLTGAAAGAGIGLTAGGLLGTTMTNTFGKTVNISKQSSSAMSKSDTSTKSRTQSMSVTKGESSTRQSSDAKTMGVTFDEINKSAQYCEEAVDKYIDRYQQGLNHGMWNVAVYLQAPEELSIEQLCHTVKSVYSGGSTHYEPIRFSDELPHLDVKKLPLIFFQPEKAMAHPIHPSFLGFTTSLNTEEFSLLAAIPTKDLPGLSVLHASDFGQNHLDSSEEGVEIGNILHRRKPTPNKLKISLESLNGHTLVSGVTGSGKTTLIKRLLQNLWNDHNIPFLVIEPVKSEYQDLKSSINNMHIFEPGTSDGLLKLNPFVPEQNDRQRPNLLGHIDSVKTAFVGAFPMYGPMPYILEDAIHRIYADRGWNLQTMEHPGYDPTMPEMESFNSDLFPTIQDLVEKIDQVVTEAGYFSDIESNIRAALKTRIKNLSIGSKQQIFGSKHAIEGRILFDKPVVVNMSRIVDDSEKAFLMGLLLSRLYQCRESQGLHNGLRHVMVIEEAHRLLPNLPINSNPEIANTRGAAVESFTNTLAELRGFGQGIVVADQIPIKLNPDVLKNTNTKIILRMLSMEDRQAVGKAINLEENQILDLADLRKGEGIVHTTGMHNACAIKIDPTTIFGNMDEIFSENRVEFLSEYPKYAYEHINEEKFWVPHHHRYLPKDLLDGPFFREKLVKIVGSSILQSKGDLEHAWSDFTFHIDFPVLPEKENIPNLHVYAAIGVFERKLSFLNNAYYFRNFWHFRNMKKNLTDLFISLSKNGDIEDVIEDVAFSFLNQRLNLNVYPSMRHVPKKSINFTLLIQECLLVDKRAASSVKEIFSDESNVDQMQAIDKSLKDMFGTVNPELRFSLVASQYCGRDIKELKSIFLDR